MKKEYTDGWGNRVTALEYLVGFHQRIEIDDGDYVLIRCGGCRAPWPCPDRKLLDSHDALLAAAEAARDEFAFVLGRTKRRKPPVKTVTEILDELEAAIEGAKS